MKTRLTTVTVEPWPVYSPEGGLPSWNVDVASDGAHARLKWSCRLGRFMKGDALMRLRRAHPEAHRQAKARMIEFCSEMWQLKGDTK